MTGFNTISDPRNQLAQLMQPAPPVQVPRNHSPYIGSPTQQTQGGQGSPLATPLIGGGLQMLGKGSAAKPATLWPQLDNAQFMGGQGPGQIMWSSGMPGTDVNAFANGAWLGGGMTPFEMNNMAVAGGFEPGFAGDAGMMLGPDFSGYGLGEAGGLALGGDAAIGGIGAAGAGEGIAAAIAANPELLLLLA